MFLIHLFVIQRSHHPVRNHLFSGAADLAWITVIALCDVSLLPALRVCMCIVCISVCMRVYTCLEVVERAAEVHCVYESHVGLLSNSTTTLFKVLQKGTQTFDLRK